MPKFILIVLSLSIACRSFSAPAPSPSSGKSSQTLKEESLTYAQELLHAILQIQSRTWKNVAVEEMIQSALIGLYESARQTLPKEFLRRANALSSESQALALLIEARKKVGMVHHWQKGDALLASCRGIARILDPHSGVMILDHSRTARLKGNGNGLGILLHPHIIHGPQRIKDIIPGSPAQRAGLHPGDLLTHLNGISLNSQCTKEIEERLTLRDLLSFETPIDGVPTLLELNSVTTEATIKLTIQRKTEKPRTLTVRLQPYREETVLGVIRRENHSWDYFVDRKKRIAHIRLSSLNRGTATELEEVLKRLEQEQMKGLILDLRWCPGGFLNEAIEIAGLFLDRGTIATIQGREQKQVYPSTREKALTKVPMVVLVNTETSGGGELIAAALQDHKRALIAGQRTRGKGTVQIAMYLPVKGVSFRITTGQFLRPSGKPLHEQGVRPSKKLEFRVSPALSKQLQQDWLKQTLRPGSERRLLPMDDLSLDGQLQVALKHISNLLR